MRKNFDPEGRGLCVFLGGYVAISCCKLGEGAVGGQDVFIVLLSFFRCDRRFGDDFIVVLAMLFRMTNSDIEPLRLVPINYLVLYV